MSKACVLTDQSSLDQAGEYCWLSTQVEDFTGKGLNDLEAGVIRTPLPPVQTFLDGELLSVYLPSVNISAKTV